MTTINETEEKILEFWKKSETFKKSIEKEAPMGNYIFYDGPPFITGLPHYATLLPSIIKDAVPRYWTMKGFRVERKWGWDCHGLPAENKVEQELGLKNKKDIEKLGVKKFVDECKNYVCNVSGQWQWYIDKIARWVDMKDDYKTMNINYMESVIWSFKELYKKDLIYEGYRSSLHCPRCATPLSKFEITMDAGSYKNVTQMSVIIKFKLRDSSKFKTDSAHILAWTTTPWTLPGNLALAVNKKIKYILIETKKENYILAKERAENILKDMEYKILKEVDGKDLINLEYEPLFNLENKEIISNKNSYKIYDAEFVTVEDGTGVVHIAPNFGEDDFELGKKHNLPMVDLMDENGIFTDEAKGWTGLYFKDAGREVMQKLGDNIFSKFNFTHSYPFCYRCSTPLIYKTQKAWYLNTDKIRDKMLKKNKNINWVPEYFKEGRFKYNLENAPHWCLSRSRYWGSPIPVWKCENCDSINVVGSIKEIEKLSGKKVNDLHRPKIDEHKFKCKCGGTMKRVPEILDCWFESGSMPYAQWHYPFERKNDFDKIFPANFITEYTGQLRGWFYYLHALSNSLFDSECFKNVIVTGVLAGTDGRKMSKSYGNYPDPKETLEKYGGDALRMYFLNSSIIIGEDMNLNEKEIQDSLRKNVMLLHNVLHFYKLSELKEVKKVESNNTLDKWIIAKLHELVKKITENMEKYDLPSATRPITGFIEDLSTWYVRLNRDRLNNNDDEALGTLKYVLEILSKITAPFMPYSAEYVWQAITKNKFKNKNKSVHLESWPDYDEKLINLNLIKKMDNLREIVSLGLQQRDQNQIGLKWPLSKAIIYNKKIKEFDKILKEQLNVKEIIFKNETKNNSVIKIDFNLTPELEAEGYAREISRKIQAMRKEAGLVKSNEIELEISSEFNDKLESQLNFIKERVGAKIISFNKSNKKFSHSEEGKIKGKFFFIRFNKI